MVKLSRVLAAVALAALLGLAASSAPAQDHPAIPEGEAHFSPAELKEYYFVYKNGDVRHLRKIFDAYSAGKLNNGDEALILGPWDRAYFRNKFIVLSREESAFNITFILLIAQDRPDRVLRAAVYKRDKKEFLLRGLEDAGYSPEEIRKMQVRYRQFFADKEHAM